MPLPSMTPAEAVAIYERTHGGEKQLKVARELGLPYHVVNDIHRGVSFGFYTGARETQSLSELADGHAVAEIPGHPNFWITADGRIIYEIAGTFRLSKYAGIDKHGYLMAYVDYKKMAVHRLLCMAFKPVENMENLIVRHLDDNPSNNLLENLCWGSHADNAEDKIRNGRMRRGEQHPNAKLTRAKVRRIRELGQSDLTHREIAVRYGITSSTVGAIIHRRSWKWFD